MRDLQRLIIYSTLLATAVSLECEVCSSAGRSCTGKKTTCSANQDTCIITVFENYLDGKSFQAVTKGCETSEFCSYPTMRMNMREGRFIRMSSTCCQEGACTPVSSKMEPEDTKTNGKQCPACFDMTGDCRNEMMDCTGSDDQCFDMILQDRGTRENITMKGCTTQPTCDRISSGKYLMFKDEKVTVRRAGCSSCPPQMPQVCELFLSTLTTILLMELFS